MATASSVSIPFKRESISKDHRNHLDSKDPLPRFNSLQTGKPIQSRRQTLPRYDTRRARFHSLQTGKPIQSCNGSLGSAEMMCFDSLPTGKHIQRLYYWADACLGGEFRFPSNGKAYPKAITGLFYNKVESFDSLQTGKPIQSVNLISNVHHIHSVVSIPFKRESISKDVHIGDVSGAIEFPFPSNGKAYPKHHPQTKAKEGNKEWFPFPSNGKAYPKPRLFLCSARMSRVSIPFKRESLSKESDLRARWQPRRQFPFPSNGKAYPKIIETTLTPKIHYHVSIPFKRESISKGRNRK